MRYLTLFIEFFKNNLIREMEFRGNFLLLTAIDGFWVFFQIIIFEIMFQFTSSIAGWHRYELYFLVGFFRLVKGVFDAFFRQNMMRFPDMVTKGDLDFVLTKPINTIFLISVRYHKFTDLGTAIAALSVLAYSVGQLSLPLTANFFVLTILLSLLSLICFYCLVFIFATCAIFIPRLTALRPYYDLINSMSRQPGEVYTKGGLIFEIAFIPLFLLSTIPSGIILGKYDHSFLVVEIVGTLILIIISYKFWNFALKRYSSASS